MTYFGRTLVYYRGSMSQAELERRLTGYGYPVSSGVIHNYESGRRQAPADIIPPLAACLQLTDDEEKALLSALIADKTAEILRDYRKARRANNP